MPEFHEMSGSGCSSPSTKNLSGLDNRLTFVLHYSILDFCIHQVECSRHLRPAVDPALIDVTS